MSHFIYRSCSGEHSTWSGCEGMIEGTENLWVCEQVRVTVNLIQINPDRFVTKYFTEISTVLYFVSRDEIECRENMVKS